MENCQILVFLAENSKILWFWLKRGSRGTEICWKGGSCWAAEGREKGGLVRRTSISPFSSTTPPLDKTFYLHVNLMVCPYRCDCECDWCSPWDWMEGIIETNLHDKKAVTSVHEPPIRISGHILAALLVKGHSNTMCIHVKKNEKELFPKHKQKS